jgi:arylsulfatase A-like enzyme
MKGGQVSRSLVEFIDLYPTIVELCQLTPPHTLSGQSLTPILADPAATIKDSAFTLVTRGPKLHAQSVRTSRWRLTQWSDGSRELYDHDRDPEENYNVAKANPAVVEELAARLKTLPPYPATP